MTEHTDNRVPEAVEQARQAYADRQEARRERLETRADNLERNAHARLEYNRQLRSVIPFGQPIIVGHHSEGRDRRFRERLWDSDGKAFADLDRAEHLADRATKVGAAGIASDDPDAVDKLRTKLAKLEDDQDAMKRINALLRKHGKAGVDAQKAALAEAFDYSPETIDRLVGPDQWGGQGFPSYKLKNNNANIRRMRKRIEELSTHDVLAELAFEGQGWEIGTGDGRVWCQFDSKEALTRDQRKSLLGGWNWSRMNERFQRKDTPNARAAARRLAEQLPGVVSP